MVEVKPMGEDGILIELGNEIDRRINMMVSVLSERIEGLRDIGVKEVIPAYTTILVVVDPLKIDREKFREEIMRIMKDIKEEELKESVKEVIEIPTLYDRDVGLDLEEISNMTGLSIERIIELHSKQVYRVYMVGFIPGFPYMGEVPEEIAVPRLDNPRLKVPAGSVGIAGNQTGIYPFEIPGGWRIIGRTPIKLFNPYQDPPTIFKIGDYVKFKPIDRETYEKMISKRECQTELRIEGEPILKVESAGPGVSIQDLGREGYRKYGVPVSGAMDKESMIISNIIVGNNINDACIEIFQSSFEATALQDIVISICGAEVEGEVDGEELEGWRAIPIRKGSKIKINSLIGGMISYIAIAGGINEPIILGSRSHYITAEIGRRITSGTIITTLKNRFKEIVDSCPARVVEWRRKRREEFRVILGPHTKYFTNEMINEFLNAKFEVTNNIDRMGYRLKAENRIKGIGRLISCGTIPGAIQIPGDGNPIVLMADAQTTGGYAIIGKIISPDLYAFSQLEPKSKVRFIQVDLNEASKIIAEAMNKYDEIIKELNVKTLKFKEKYKHWIVKFQGKIYDCWISRVKG